MITNDLGNVIHNPHPSPCSDHLKLVRRFRPILYYKLAVSHVFPMSLLKKKRVSQ